MEQAFECTVNIFHQYALLRPIDDYLQLEEFKKLMKEQASIFLKDTTPSGVDENTYIKQLFQKADKDHNGNMKFTEFVTVLGLALIDAHNRSHQLGEGGHGHGHSHGDGHGHSHGDGHGHGH